jgi:hypothetical protein
MILLVSDHSTSFREHSASFREHSTWFREHSTSFREHSAWFREHSTALGYPTLSLSLMGGCKKCLNTAIPDFCF